MEIQKRVSRNMEKKTRKYLVDMLNLIFGCGEETDIYWKYVID